ncbi:MAG: hypothetical protein P1V19_07390 [Gimesia sp.]|nr:hypothetical protein [Gimesia sp.]
MKNVIEDVTCAGCCCVCDDIQVTTDGQQILEVQTTCPLGQAWFKESLQTGSLSPQVKGVEASHAEAVKSAVDLIQKAQAPLIFGLAQSATDAQRTAVSLADQIGATIDTGASATTRALQQVGEATCTLGEVRSRADLIIYWGADTLLANQCHRQSLSSGSQEIPRTILSIGTELSSASEYVDKTIPLEPQQELEAIWSLRAVLKGIDLGGKQPTGIAEDSLQKLVALIQQSKYVVFFYGPEFKEGPLSHRKIEALSTLIQELQTDRRCHGISVPPAGETKGLENVLAWQTGYAASVNFASGYPRYSPGEYSANALLEQDEIDLCILVGANPLSGLSVNAQQRLARIPVILIGPAMVELPDLHTFLPTGISGIHFPGSVYRFDGTPLPLRGYLSTPLSSEATVLTEIISSVKQPATH